LNEFYFKVDTVSRLYPGPSLSQWDQLGPVLELSTLGCSSTHNNTQQVLQRTTGPAPPKDEPKGIRLICTADEMVSA
jgi:hypothetical protein